jgi:hypothetical protein
MLTPRDHSHTPPEQIGWLCVKCPIWSGWTTGVTQPDSERCGPTGKQAMTCHDALHVMYLMWLMVPVEQRQDAGPSHCSGGSADDIFSRITP